MLGRLWVKTLYERRRALLWWGVGIAVTTVSFVAMYQAVLDVPDVDQLLESYPEAFRKVFEMTDITSPAGFLHTYFLSLMAPVLFLVHAIGFGGSTTTEEERDKTIDLLATLPISRARIVAEKALAMVVAATGLGVVMFASMWVGAALVGMAISAWHLAAASAAVVLLGLCFGAVALLVGTLTGRRGTSLGIAGAIAAAAFALNMLAPLSDALDRLRVLSPAYHAVGIEPLRHGLGLEHAAVLVILTSMLLAGAALVFDRRELTR
jgi:ABC-2 type transport system permease protein